MMDRLYKILERLIAFDTVSSRPDTSAIEYVASLIEPLGFRIALQRIEIDGTEQVNLVASVGPPVADGLIISGHIDTVPFAGQPGWEHDPLKMEIVGDRIFGRGTSDMKGFIAQCLDAASQLDRTRLKRPLVFAFSASEEVGTMGAEFLAPEMGKLLGETPVPKLAWIGEPSTNAVFHAHKSIVSFEVRVRGRGGHSGAPEHGANAIAVMAKAIDTIGRYQAERRAARDEQFAATFESPYDVLNFGTVRGGLAGNIIAEECRLVVTYRSMPKAEPLAMYREIERRLEALEPRDWGSEHRAAIELSPPRIVPPLWSPLGTPLEKVLFDLTGARRAGGAVYGTDGGHFAQHGITSLICGPGDLDQAHRPNESIRRDLFARGPAMVLKVIDRMCCA